MTGSITWNSKKQGVDQADFVCNRHPKFLSGFEIWYKKKTLTLKRQEVKNLLKDANENGVKLSHQAPTLYDVVPKEEITEFEELMRKTIADIVSEASSVACWVYVQKYVKQKTLDEMLQELPGAGQFIIVMDTWFERLMAE